MSDTQNSNYAKIFNIVYALTKNPLSMLHEVTFNHMQYVSLVGRSECHIARMLFKRSEHF